MMYVLKRDGSKEAFDARKLKKSISRAFIDAGLDVKENKALIEKLSEEVVEDVSRKGDMDTGAIRHMVLYRLDKLAPAVSESWRNFECKKVSMCTC